MYGNTRAIAELSQRSSETTAGSSQSVTQRRGWMLTSSSLAGRPICTGLSTSLTRNMAARGAEEDEDVAIESLGAAEGPGLREWLKNLEGGRRRTRRGLRHSRRRESRADRVRSAWHRSAASASRVRGGWDGELPGRRYRRPAGRRRAGACPSVGERACAGALGRLSHRLGSGVPLRIERCVGIERHGGLHADTLAWRPRRRAGTLEALGSRASEVPARRRGRHAQGVA